MTGSPESPAPVAPLMLRLGPERVTAELLAAITHGAVLARADATVLALSGPGAVASMQGLLTNDVEKSGEGGFLYGAMLTPKGMIVVEGWVARRGTTVTYVVPTESGARVRALFGRSVPPRLAQTVDQTADVQVFRLVGPRSFAAADMAGLGPVPPAGHAAAVADAPAWEIARPGETAPFALQLTGPLGEADAVMQRFRDAGVELADAVALEAARILAGWPAPGAEIDDKTIPQEVRFDELGGVSYTKGCYTGQETVSRLHFRGHVNRGLRGLLFETEPSEASYTVTRLDREVGRVTSVMWLPEKRWIGLAMLRREVSPGDMARAGDSDVRVVALPFSL